MAAPAAPPTQKPLFAAPRPIRQLFKLFPLRVHEAEPLPARAPDRPRARAELHVFSTDDDAARGLPSYNPTCLKWQTLLRIAGLQTDLVPSTNHASPSGALPFLLPSSSDSRPDVPLTGDRIAQYARKHSSLAGPLPGEPLLARQQAYTSLLAQNIRPAWLYTLYLDPVHTPLLSRLYLPRSPLLRRPLLQSLRAAATREILKTTRRGVVQPSQIYHDAKAALAALSALLGDQEWFFGEPAPGLFDAELFAYTYLIGHDGMGWEDGRLAECLAGCGNLVGHAGRLYERCWG